MPPVPSNPEMANRPEIVPVSSRTMGRVSAGFGGSVIDEVSLRGANSIREKRESKGSLILTAQAGLRMSEFGSGYRENYAGIELAGPTDSRACVLGCQTQHGSSAKMSPVRA